MDSTAREILKTVAPPQHSIVYPLEFYSDHVQKADGKFELEDYCEWARKGEAQPAGNSRVKIIMKHNPDVWAGLAPFYEAWKKNEGEPVNGTPLAQWVCPGLGKHLVKHLQSLNVRTVEDIAQANDQICQKIGMGALKIREYAREYVKTKEGQAVIAAELVERDDKIASQAQEIGHLKSTLENLERKFNDYLNKAA